ncbi:MAG: Ig-like domain-containing protein [Burkholderiales bacterium]|nr:Ig-like domain-containing protein [Burkholderiales bacterium]
MSKCESHSRFLTWFIPSLLSALAAGCGGGGQGPTPGGGGIAGLAPAVTLTVPLATTPIVAGVELNSKITATFTKDMAPATISTSTFTLACPAAVPGTVAYVAASRVAVFSPTANLPAGATCTATVTAGATDTTGIPLDSNFTWTFATGAVLDTTPPRVSATIPANNATGVPINIKVAATFSEAMDPSTITTATFTLKQGATDVPGTVTYSGVSAVFAPASNLAASTTYTATITTGARCLEGIAMAANYAWSWTTAAAPDTAAPTVTGTIHANNATNVVINTKVGATFSEGMDPLTITNVNFTLKETVSGTAVAGTVTYSGVSAVFIPLNNLTYNTGYTATVKGGLGGVKDLAGNPMAGDFVIGWTTAAAADTTPPTVTGITHTNGATNVAVNTKIGATFSEGMDPLTINTTTFTLKQGATAVPGTVTYSGVTAVFTPASNLAASTTYTATITTGVQCLAGIAMASDYAWVFTTAAAPDTTAPTVTGTIHANNATDVAINTKVGATFSEGMDPLTITNVNFTLKEAVTGTAVAGTVSYSGVSAAFVPLSNLAHSTNYIVTVKGGVSGVKDLAGNPLASDFVISWTTAAVPDTTAPTVSLTVPANAATGVLINTKIAATFSEAMDPLTITNLTFTVAGVSGTVTSDALNRIATFTPASNLATSTLYAATITTGARDMAGNALAESYSWRFTSYPRDYTAWSDQGIVYTAPAGDAYYPSVVFDLNGFGGAATHAMWYTDGSGAVFLVTSSNGTSWSSPATITGLGGRAHHIQLLYDANHFGLGPSGPSYRMWYWDIGAASLYDISSMATAQSTDGVNWVNNTALTQDASARLVTGIGTGWNRGSYGPVSLFYQPGAANSGTDPWRYSYTMYYDGTDGSREQTGLAYSADGVFWKAYVENPVLSISPSPAWDSNDAVYGTVYRNAIGLHFWYSGGVSSPNDGIGYAFSTDGKTWTKNSTPVFHITDGAAYRNSRTSTPSVINDGSGTLKMYYTAVGPGGTKQIGLALLPP